MFIIRKNNFISFKENGKRRLSATSLIYTLHFNEIQIRCKEFDSFQEF
jgi:hypothetical protein